MKEATGELSMTTVTIIAVIAIAAIVALLADPVKNYIKNTWQNMTGEQIVENTTNND